MKRVGCFKELEVWNKARRIRKRIYFITRSFPRWEQYGVGLQMRKAAVSTTANIVEGYGKQSLVENRRFCRISRGSALELRDHLTTAYDEKYVTSRVWKELDLELISLGQLLSAYIRSMTKNVTAKQARGRNTR